MKKNIKTRITTGLSGLALLGAVGCRTVKYEGVEIDCIGSYPIGHPCYQRPSISSSSSYQKDYGGDGSSGSGRSGGHYEGCR